MSRNEQIRPRAEKGRQARRTNHNNEPTDPSRRKFLIAAGLGVAGLALSAYGVPKIIDLLSPDKPEEFSGDIDEVRFYLGQWENEVGTDRGKLEKKLPQIVQLSTAYFSAQMTEMFPERKADYDKKIFKDKVVIMDKNSFVEKHKSSACGATDPSDGDIWGFVDTAENNEKIYINKDFNFGTRPVPGYFKVMLHELTHIASRKKVYSQPISSYNVPVKVSYEQGLAAFAREERLDTPSSKCFTRYRYQADEAVVDHNARELFSSLGLTFQGSPYDNLVKNYKEQVIDKLYEGNYKELLGYQQLTQPTEFFRSIGRKLIGGPLDAKVEEEIGSNYMISLLL